MSRFIEFDEFSKIHLGETQISLLLIFYVFAMRVHYDLKLHLTIKLLGIDVYLMQLFGI